MVLMDVELEMSVLMAQKILRLEEAKGCIMHQCTSRALSAKGQPGSREHHVLLSSSVLFRRIKDAQDVDTWKAVKRKR